MPHQHVQADIGCSAFLLSSGYELVGLKEISTNRIGFVFSDPARTCQQEAKNYFSGCAINAQKLVLALRTLKTRLRVAKEQNHKEFKEYEYHPECRQPNPTL